MTQHEVHCFSIVPIEVNLDPRLSLQDIRVLIALLSFRDKTTNLCWPSREKLAERCRMHISNISYTTSRLEQFGWVTKHGKGGYSKATRYEMHVPDLTTVAEQTTVVQSTTVVESTTLVESTTRNRSRSHTTTVVEPTTRIEQTIEHTKEQTNKVSRGTRLPATWYPDPQLIMWAKQQRPDINLHDTTESFKDYWHGVSGAKGIKLDWDATFRNWIRNQRGQRSPAQTSYQQSMKDKFDQLTGNRRSEAINGNIIDVTPEAKRLGG